MTTTLRLLPEPIDMSAEPHLSGLFAPTTNEIDVNGLHVDGELPPDIDGDYLRNGPNPRFSRLGGFVFPLDGDGMLHRVRIRDGEVGYGNRFVRTPSLRAEEAAGRALWAGVGGGLFSPGEDQVGPELAHTIKDMPDINVVRHGGKLLALAEAANPFLIDDELATVGRETYAGDLPAGMTAHPKIDPRTGEMVIFNYQFSAPYLTWAVIGSSGSVVRPPTPVTGVDRPVMIHDMALTATYVVLVVAPFFFDLAAAHQGGSLLSWEPEKGTRIALIPRDGAPIRWLTTDAFWMWHTANAYDQGDTVVLDFVRWDAPGLVSGNTHSDLSRLVLTPTTGAVNSSTLADRAMEFPRIDDRAITGGHQIIGSAMQSGRQQLIVGDEDMLGWHDSRTGSFTTWNAGNLAVGEQTYIPRPGDPDPTSGWWTTIATDRTDHTSKLLIIPAADPASGPVATVHLPQRVPLGLHGSWQPTQE